MREAIAVVLADDHELVRRGIREVLGEDRDIDVVGEAAGAQEAIALIQRLQPDVAIVDIRLGEDSGLDVALATREMSPRTRVLMLTAYDYGKYMGPLLRAGAHGCLSKDASAEELRQAVRTVAQGGVVGSAQTGNGVVIQGGGGGTLARGLTTRERQVLTCIVRGLRNREISAELGLSLKTVEAHIKRILVKLGVSSRTQAVVQVIGWGGIPGAMRPGLGSQQGRALTGAEPRRAATWHRSGANLRPLSLDPVVLERTG